MRVRQAIQPIFLLVAAFILAACAESQLALHVAKKLQRATTDKASGGAGAYEVGKPYQIKGVWYYPREDPRYSKTGIASWYGEKFDGRRTANGEIYDMYAMTAAHKTLPLGTYVRVRNLENNREIDVRVNDRGPFVRGRIIDLSYTSAKKIGLVGPGTAPVEIVALGAPAKPWDKTKPPASYVPVDYTKGNFTIQVGAFQNRENAERLKQSLNSKYKNVHITAFDSGSGILYRVRIGKFTDLNQATERETILIGIGFSDAFTVAE